MKRIIYVYDTCTIDIFEQQIGITKLVNAMDDKLDGTITFYEDEYAEPRYFSQRTFDVTYKVIGVDAPEDSLNTVISFFLDILSWHYDDYEIYSKLYVVDDAKN